MDEFKGLKIPKTIVIRTNIDRQNKACSDTDNEECASLDCRECLYYSDSINKFLQWEIAEKLKEVTK